VAAVEVAVKSPSLWTAGDLRRTTPITDADHERLLMAAYAACGPGEDVRKAMAERLSWALDALEREEAAASGGADHEHTYREGGRCRCGKVYEPPKFADGTMPGTETLHGPACLCAGTWCRERPER
jgi:hypothetical protein